MRYLLTFTILSLALSAIGQGFQPTDVAFLGNAAVVASIPASSWDPMTSIAIPFAGYTNNTYSTNSGVAVWPDKSGHSYDLTGVVSGNQTYASQDLNGLRVLKQNGINQSWLSNSVMPWVAPFEIFCVLNLTLTNPGTQYYFVPTNVNPYGFFRVWDQQSGMSVGCSGSFNTGKTVTTNKWQVWEIVMNGASSSMYTNNSLFGSGNAGSLPGGTVGLFLDSYTSGGSAGYADFAELFFYTNLLTRDQATSNYYYFTNKYNLLP